MQCVRWILSKCKSCSSLWKLRFNKNNGEANIQHKKGFFWMFVPLKNSISMSILNDVEENFFSVDVLRAGEHHFFVFSISDVFHRIKVKKCTKMIFFPPVFWWKSESDCKNSIDRIKKILFCTFKMRNASTIAKNKLIFIQKNESK